MFNIINTANFVLWDKLEAAKRRIQWYITNINSKNIKYERRALSKTLILLSKYKKEKR